MKIFSNFFPFPIFLNLKIKRDYFFSCFDEFILKIIISFFFKFFISRI